MGEAGAKGAQPPQDRYGQGQYGQGQKLASPQLTPSEFWNEDTRNQWFSRSNLGTAILDGVETTCLIDNGARVNLVTLEFIWDSGPACGFHPGLGSTQMGTFHLSDWGGRVMEPLGYMMLWVQTTLRAKLR